MTDSHPAIEVSLFKILLDKVESSITSSKVKTEILQNDTTRSQLLIKRAQRMLYNAVPESTV